MTGELGELANLIKKIERGDMTLEEARSDVSDELADVVTYLDILAFRCGVDLGAATMSKFNRVSERVGSNVYLDAEDWHYRGGKDGHLESQKDQSHGRCA